MQVGRVGSHDESIRVRAGGGGFKTIKYVSILTVYFPFLKIFSKKKKKEREKMIETIEISLMLHMNS